MGSLLDKHGWGKDLWTWDVTSKEKNWRVKRKKYWEKQKRIAKSCGHLQKCVTYAQCKKKEEEKHNRSNIWSNDNNFFQINVTHKITEHRSLKTTK